jgi:hypothetical protein
LNGDERRVLDAHRRGQFVSLSLVRTGGPRHRFSTSELDGGPRHRFSTTELDERPEATGRPLLPFGFRRSVRKTNEYERGTSP